MLGFVIGTAGTGKSSWIIDRLAALAAAGGEGILLVPEQFSFEAERQVHRRLGARLAMQVEVLSFTRLCNMVFRAFGGLAGVPVTQTGRYLLMSVAVDELRDSLRVYRRSANNPAFLETLLSACAEFKTAGLTPERLGEVAARAAESTGPLADKLGDLTSLYAAYQALLARGYSDPEDDLIRACALLETNDFFGGKQIFVDGFATFMAGEFQLLGHAVRQADAAVFAFTADSTDDAQRGIGVFSPAKLAMRRLRRDARQAGVPVDSPVVLTRPHRYQNAELAHLADCFLLPGSEVWPEPPSGDSVRLHRAEDLYREIEYVAARIAALVREEGYRYSEIAVVARDTGPYLRALESVFGRWELPWFADRVEDAENKPLTGGLLAAVEAVRSHFDAQAVLAYAKNPVAGLDARRVAELENYCYTWSVRGRLWFEPFANNPRGMAERFTERDEAELARVNETRERLVGPLLRLRDGVEDADGRGFAGALFAFLEEIDADGNLLAFAERLPAGEREAFLDESAQLWDAVIEILDVFGAVLGGAKPPAGRLCELLRLSLTATEIGQVPQMLDGVLVGTANRIRPSELRAVFVIGANEGIFPADCAGAGVFTDEERQMMIELGAEIAAPTLSQAVLEKFFAYFAVTLPAERLYVSWPSADPAGAQRLPSVIVGQLEALFPALEPDGLREDELAVNPATALMQLAGRVREDDPRTASLRAFLERRAPDLLARVEQAADKPQHALRDPRLAEGLFGGNLRLSPTRVERYYRCPFSYFVQDGLRLRRRGRVEFNPLESGSVIHHVLQLMVRRHGAALHELDDKQLDEEIREIIFEYIKSRVERMDTLPTRFQYLFGRLSATLTRLLRHLGAEMQQSEFAPYAFELPINAGGGEDGEVQDRVAPLELRTADGRTVLVEGTVDRVDLMEKNGRRYLRVMDYKSGGKQFKLEDVLYGLNLQMLLYLFTLTQNGRGELSGALPAGVLYMPVHNRYVNAGRDTPDEAVERELLGQWRMNGLLLEDEEALAGMERDLKGVFIPVRRKKDGGFDARSPLAGKAEMGRLARKVGELIVSMADSLHGGEIPSCPAVESGFNPCEYCDWAAVCGFEEGDAVREIAKMDRKEVFKLLEEESDG